MSLKNRLQNSTNVYAFEEEEAEKEIFAVPKTKGYGILNGPLYDRSVDKIFVNNNVVYVEKKGREYRTSLSFNNPNELLDIIENLSENAPQIGNKNNGFLSFKLKDIGSIIAFLPPNALDFPVLFVRKAKDITGSLESLVGLDSISKEISLFLEAVVNLDLNILISGSENSGKTTLLGAMAKKIGSEKKILSVEKMPELKFNQEQVIRLCASDDGNNLGALLKQGLKLNPNKIILSDCDTKCARTLLEASINGKNFITTINANSIEGAINKISNMVEINKDKYNFDTKEVIFDNIDVIIQLTRLEKGSVKISDISVINHKTSQIERVFYWDYTDGIGGKFYSCGTKPEFLDGTGFEISDLIFEKDYEHTDNSAKNEVKASQKSDDETVKSNNHSKGNGLFKKFRK